MIQLNTQQTTKFWQITITDRLDHLQADALSQALTTALESDTPRLMLDLSQATYINSGGLRLLVSAWRTARQKGGNMVLFGLSDKVQEVFAMVGFDKVFQIATDQETATLFLEETEQ